MSPPAVRGLATDCVVGGANVVVHDLATRVKTRRWRARRWSELGRDGSEREVEVREGFDEGIRLLCGGKNWGV